MMFEFMKRGTRMTAAIILVTTIVLLFAIEYYREAAWTDFSQAKGISNTEGVTQFRCAANELYYVVPTGKITDTAFKYSPTISCTVDETEDVNEAGSILRAIVLLAATFFFLVLVILPLDNKQGESEQ